MTAGGRLDGDARLGQPLAEISHLTDAIGQILLVHPFPQADGQRRHVTAGETAVGNEPLHRHAAHLHRAEQVEILLEAAKTADIDQPVLFGRHGEHVPQGKHLAYYLLDAALGVIRVALLDKPGVFGKAGGIDHHRNMVTTCKLGNSLHIAHGDRLTASTVAGDSDDDSGHVVGPQRLYGVGQATEIEIPLPGIRRSGVEGLWCEQVDGPRARQLYMGLGGVEVVVGDEDRRLALATLDQLGKEDLLGPAPLVGGHHMLVAKQLAHGTLQLDEVAAARIGFIPHHDAGPLAIGHGARAAVGQQIDIDIFGQQQEGIPASGLKGGAALGASGLFDGLDHLDTKGFGYTTHIRLLTGARPVLQTH